MSSAILTERRDATPLSAGTDPRIRGAIALIVTRFPRLDEPIVLREMNELERHGQPVVLIPLQREPGKIIHEEAKPWLRRAFYTPRLSLAILLANVVYAIRHPRKYTRLLYRLIAGTIGSPAVLFRTLALVPQSVYLARELRHRGVRHVHAHFATDPATSAYIISKLSDITFSFTMHGPDVFVHRLLMREKLESAKFVRAVSTFVKAFITGLFPKASKGKIEVVHGGVNPEVYMRAAAQAPRTGKPRIFSVARLTETKGFHLLIDACARLKRDGLDFVCEIAGEGPTYDELEAAIRHFDVADHVTLLGPRPQDEVARLMGGADIFILPSVIAYNGQMDGTPVALMEAMAAGVAVVASPISGIPELVEHERTGLLVDVNQPEHIATALRRLILDRELRAQLGRQAREKVRLGFDVRRTSAQLVDLFVRHDDRRPVAHEEISSLEWSKLGASALGIRRIERGGDSLTAEVTITNGETRRDVIVRFRGDATTAEEEFDMQSRLRERLESVNEDETQHTRYTVPKPLMLDEEHAAVVVERAPGRQLRSMIREARTRGSARRITAALRRTGNWLRLMQQVTRCDEDGRHLLTATVINALRDLELVSAADRTLARNAPRIRAALRRLESDLAGKPLPVVGRHGRFRPLNVYIGERRVDVTDFVDFREGLPLEDVTNFLIHLETYFVNPLFPRELASMASAFLDGYSGGQELDPASLRFFTIVSALQMLARGGIEEDGKLRYMQRLRTLRRAIFRGIA